MIRPAKAGGGWASGAKEDGRSPDGELLHDVLGDDGLGVGDDGLGVGDDGLRVGDDGLGVGDDGLHDGLDVAGHHRLGVRDYRLRLLRYHRLGLDKCGGAR